LLRLVQTKCELRPFTTLVAAAREVAGAGAFDLDHARAEVGDLAGAVGGRDRVFEHHDSDDLEGQHLERPR
jgi:hypothetical protein